MDSPREYTREEIRAHMFAQNGRNWEMTPEDIQAADNAIDTALERLGKTAGGDRLTVDNADYFDLAANAAWYILNGRWPEFEQNYSGDLLILRLREAFGCGK